MTTVAEGIGVSRSNLMERMPERPKKGIGRRPLPDGKLVAEIKAVIAELPTYGYRRVHAILKRQALAAGLKPSNHKRVYRVMKVHGLLLDRHAGGVERRHDGRIAVDKRNRRWCSDGFEIGCDNGERVRVAFALDCCDREAMSFLATTSGVTGEDVRDLMLAAVEDRFGPVNRLPVTIEWLSDNGSCDLAGETRSFARDIGLEPRTTPIESPQSNGIAEAFVRTIKRDYVRVSPCPDADTVMHQLSAWINQSAAAAAGLSQLIALGVIRWCRREHSGSTGVDRQECQQNWCGPTNYLGRHSHAAIEVNLSLSETYALKYWWCGPPRTGIASVRPTVWTARGTGARGVALRHAGKEIGLAFDGRGAPTVGKADSRRRPAEHIAQGHHRAAMKHAAAVAQLLAHRQLGFAAFGRAMEHARLDARSRHETRVAVRSSSGIQTRSSLERPPALV